MNKINIKPLSVNDAWQGKRFKTARYKKYERDLILLLPNITLPKGEIEIYIEWGFSSKASDIDNPTKNFIDVLQKKYKFDDKNIYKAVLKKRIVSKGQEYIKFSFKEYKE